MRSPVRGAVTGRALLSRARKSLTRMWFLRLPSALGPARDPVMLCSAAA